MPKAILAMRSYPATFALAILLFLLTLMITTGSLGKVRSGGDGGDGGSGMGGTGKSGEFGGSGFGGTGGPSPFFTVTDPVQDDHENLQATEPAVAVELPDIAPPSTLIAQDPPPVITEPETAQKNPVVEVIESHPLVEETRQEIAQDETEVSASPAVEEVQESLQLVEAKPELSPISTAPSAAEQDLREEKVPNSGLEENTRIATTEDPQAVSPETRTSETRDVPQLAETITVTLDPDADTQEATRERPERIQRPELPPFQRITPVQRPTLLPPRVQPMRI